MNKGLMLVGLAIVVIAVGGYFVLNSNKPASTATTGTQTVATSPTTIPAMGTETATVESTGVVKEFTVDGSNFKFVPAVMNVKKGDTVKITFKNTEGFHDLVIDELNVRTNQIKDGEEEEVEFVADKVGTFEYYCSVGQHRQMGMKGNLIVE